MIIGAFLRFSRLGVLPPWTDEVATMVFSIGNNFQNVPLNEIISADTLLQPLIPRPDASYQDVIDSLFTESTHPPVYFLLSYLWIKFFPLDDGLVSLWGMRSLGATLGVLAIPAMFISIHKSFNSRVAGMMAAALMALSPYGIFLSQQARHYTLAILFIIISLTCLIKTIQALYHQETISPIVSLIWIIANSLGMATHYFFGLVLAIEGGILAIAAWQQAQQKLEILFTTPWRRIYGIGLGTLASCLILLPIFFDIYGSPPTTWVYDGDTTQDFISPLLRFILWGLSMIMLLPSAVDLIPMRIVTIFGAITLGILLWLIPCFSYGLNPRRYEENRSLVIKTLALFLGLSILIFLLFTYIFSADLTLVPRFHFVYFPVMIALFSISMASCWEKNLQPLRKKNQRKKRKTSGLIVWKFLEWLKPSRKYSRIKVVVFLAIVLISSLTTVFNLGYLQNHRPDLMVSEIVKTSQTNPIVILTTHRHHVQTGTMISLAWGFKHSSSISPQFFLADIDETGNNYTESGQQFETQLQNLPRPLDLWLINFRSDLELESQGCLVDFQHRNYAGQYKYKLYHCQR
jgi:uncharacterized membrane protein